MHVINKVKLESDLSSVREILEQPTLRHISQTFWCFNKVFAKKNGSEAESCGR